MTRRHWVLMIRIILSVVVLTFLVMRVDLSLVRSQLASASPLLMVGGLALFLARNVLQAWRWLYVIRAWQVQVPFGQLVRLIFVGASFTLILPTAAGGDLARWAMLPRERLDRTMAAQTVFTDRLVGFAALGLVAAVALPWAWNLVPDPWARGAVAAMLPLALISLTAALRPGWIPAAWRRRVPLVRATAPWSLAPAGLAALAAHLVSVTAVMVLGRALGDTTSAVVYGALLPLIWLLSMVPVSMGGLGVREGSFVALFSAAGMSPATAMAVAGLWLLMTLIQAMVGAVVLLVWRRQSSAPTREDDQRPTPAVIPAGTSQ